MCVCATASWQLTARDLSSLKKTKKKKLDFNGFIQYKFHNMQSGEALENHWPGLSLLTHLFNIAWESGTVPGDVQTGAVVPIKKKKKRIRGCVLIIVKSHSSACLGKPVPEFWKGESHTCWPSAGEGPMQISSRTWKSRPAFYPDKSPGGDMGLCLSSLHVFCRFGEGLWPCPPGMLEVCMYACRVV